jgi:hypothetical protein
MLEKIKDKYYSIKNGISNVIRWAPTIWKLRDWDAEYLYLLIYKHLSHVEDCLRYNGHGVNSVKEADKVRIAKNLAKRLYEKEYVNNALISVEEKYGELKIRIEKDDTLPMYSKVIFDETPEERKARNRAYKHSDYMEKQDRQMLFEMLNKYIDKWWD